MIASIVVGLQFGDEGKGMTTASLCTRTEKPLVIRFNGGHQAGHTVIYNGQRHVFSNFGSGTLHGIPTFWSRFCTFNPISVANEFEALRSFQPILYVDPLCPVTTPFDRFHNIKQEVTNQHGSCGVGFGATLQRQEDYYKLHVQDLFYPAILRAKLDNIIAYYKQQWAVENSDTIEEAREIFLRKAERAAEIILTSFNIKKYDHLIFEGSQGILLDMDFGFFPNVTRSNTTSKNAHQLLAEWAIPTLWPVPNVYYVTRSYQTRHGNGFMTNEEIAPMLVNNEQETNVTNQHQGKFRIGALDEDLLRYALACDDHFSSHCRKYLIVTCLDQTGDHFPITTGGIQESLNATTLADRLGIKFVRTSNSPNGLMDRAKDVADPVL